MFVCMCLSVSVCVCVYMWCLCLCVLLCVVCVWYVRLCVCVCICMSVCMSMCVCVSVGVLVYVGDVCVFSPVHIVEPSLLCVSTTTVKILNSSLPISIPPIALSKTSPNSLLNPLPSPVSTPWQLLVCSPLLK